MGEILDDYRRRGQVPSTLQQSDSNIFRLFGDVYSKTYEAGALSPKVKELIALAMGLVRTCDDCTIYHLSQLRDLEASRREIHETLALVLIVGGSALIPSIRRADLVYLCGASSTPTERPQPTPCLTPARRTHLSRERRRRPRVDPGGSIDDAHPRREDDARHSNRGREGRAANVTERR